MKRITITITHVHVTSFIIIKEKKAGDVITELNYVFGNTCYFVVSQNMYGDEFQLLSVHIPSLSEMNDDQS